MRVDGIPWKGLKETGRGQDRIMGMLMGKTGWSTLIRKVDGKRREGKGKQESLEGPSIPSSKGTNGFRKEMIGRFDVEESQKTFLRP